VTPPIDPRCPWAVQIGKLATRCHKRVSHAHGDPSHEGSGLSQFPYQKIQWFPGDRREFETDREDLFAWEGS
jgi:hypothetical protein